MGFGFTKKEARKTLFAQYSLFALTMIMLLLNLEKILSASYTNLKDLFLATLLCIIFLIFLFVFLLHREFLTKRIAAKVYLLTDKNMIDKAKEKIDKKIKSNFMGYNANWLSLKSMILIKNGELRYAEDLLNKLEKMHPNFPQMLYFKACLKSKKKEYNESINYLIKFFKILRKIKKESKDLLYKYYVNKNMKRFLHYAKIDEDLEGVRKKDKFMEVISSFK